MTRLLLILVCGATLLASIMARAEQELTPFQASYRLYVSKIPTIITANLSLTRQPEHPDLYSLELNVKSVLVKNTELSRFYWNQCDPQTDTYVHDFRGFGRRRSHHMQFEWDPPRVTNEEGDGDNRTYDIEAGTLDDLTLFLKARCVFARGDKSFTATSAYGNKLRTQTLEVVGAESLNTPAGKLDTLIVEKRRDDDSERTTRFWVAPSLDYVVVRALHVENRALFGELVLREFEEGNLKLEGPDAVDPEQANAGAGTGDSQGAPDS